jgi:cytidine deaminase
MTPAAIADLLERAAVVSAHAHCPYSQYQVGSALLGADGHIYAGCNVENASYGLTICAERNAVFQAVAAGCRAFTAVAIVSGGPAMPFPCGACRQVLAEFGSPDLPVYIAVRGALGAVTTTTLGTLLPHSFRLSPA